MPKQSYTEEELFTAALAFPESERLRYLERACAADSALFDRLRSLLEDSASAAAFMYERDRVARAGIDIIGSYRIVTELGEGGCGVAYLAEQIAPVRREVALKVIKPGMDTRTVIARFEAERQTLALMDHPHVAKVFDAGATSAGRPYFVMELVRGIKITDYCNHSRLSVRERLVLFIQVCHAIQHAHLKGIIHRDIKPSNVLVTMHDGAAIAKVIDFGIAKAMQGRLTGNAVDTALEQFIGTPAYVSPEQTEPGRVDVDTRSDIYSLGVLLYELLTGCTPFAATTTTRANVDRVRRLLREEDPDAPSRRLKALGRDAAQIQTDLDWIVMRCLERDRECRYQSVGDLTAEVERYLNDEPVAARPPSLAYVLGKFVRRHRTAVIASVAASAVALSVLALVAMSGQISTERANAQRGEDRAHRVSSVMLEVLATTDPFESSGPEVNPGTVLEAAERSARTELRHEPRAQADLLEAIGKAYRRRGDIPRSGAALEDALRLRELTSDYAGTMVTAAELIHTLRLAGALQRAEGVLTEAFARAKRHGLESTAAYVELLRERGRNNLALGNPGAARRDLDEALILAQTLFGAQSRKVAGLKGNLSATYLWTDDLHEGELAAREAIAIYQATLPPGHPTTAQARTHLGDALFAQNRYDEAAVQYLAAFESLTRTLDDNNQAVANTLDALAQTRQAQGQLAQAEGFARSAIAAYSGSLGARSFQTAYARLVLGAILIRRSRFAEAEDEQRLALDIFHAELPADHQYIAASEHRLGEALLGSGRLAEAESVLLASMARWNRAGAPAWRAARSANALGEALYRQGRLDDARRYLAESAAVLEADPKAEEWARHKARERTAMYLHPERSHVAQTH
jgi:eukaryotic-like serine/threonine-protein kinase